LPTPGADLSLPGYVTSSLPEFVPPHLTELEAASPGRPQVVVLSAPGAVGKSTLAREVSYARKAPLWDLARYDSFARGTLIGALGPAFEFHRLATVLGHLAAGTLFVVIDALDEARLKAGSEASFMDFLEDIGKVANSAQGVAFVLLGRTGIAEESWFVLTDLGVQTSLYRIDFFDEAQRVDYLDLRLQKDPVTARYVAAHRAEFTEARDLLFAQLGEAIHSQDGKEDTWEAAAFLGYPPVLHVIAVLFSETKRNYRALIEELRQDEQQSGTGAGLSRIRLLNTVVEKILDREQDQKVISNLKPVLANLVPRGWSDWHKLYTRDEQRGRLLARFLQDPWTPRLDVPSEIRARYENQLTIFFNEHPFLREAKSAANVVFEAYLFADAMIDPTHPLRDRVAGYIEQTQALPSRLLADFYFFFREAAKQPIPLPHVGLLYGSLLSGETESRRLHLELDAGDPDPDEWAGTNPSVEFEWVDPTADGPEAAHLGSVITPLNVEATDRLTFRRLLKDASITLPSIVRLETRTSEFVIGPEVQIRAKRLEISNAETLVVKGVAQRTGDAVDDQLVVLEALSSDVASVSKVTSYGILSVRWPGCRAYPWTPYASETAQDVENDPRLLLVYRRFRRIAMAFRSHKKGQPARIKDKIDHERICREALGKALLSQLLVDNVLYPQGKSYFWNRPVANELMGVSWQDLRRGFSPPKLINYIRRFADTHADLLKPA